MGLDLLMNCVAVNFVLDIDSEWVSSAQQGKAKGFGEDVFKKWRNTCEDNKAEITESIRQFTSLRRSAPGMVAKLCSCGDKIIMVCAYLLAFGWTVCPSNL